MALNISLKWHGVFELEMGVILDCSLSPHSPMQLKASSYEISLRPVPEKLHVLLKNLEPKGEELTAKGDAVWLP